MQYAVEFWVYGGGASLVEKGHTHAVCSRCSGCSRIVIYGGGDIVFDTKSSNEWTQYTVDAVE